jgi:hypothetical protein
MFTLTPVQLLGAAVLLAGCATQPAPEWQANAHSALQRATRAYLAGADRVATAEWRLAQTELARTAQPEQVFRGVVLNCAVHQSALQLHHCTPAHAVQQQASAADAAYVRYLSAAHQLSDVPLLPAAQQAVAAALLAGDVPNLASITDSLSRLVAASVVLQQRGPNPALLQTAVDTASAQGWRKPLLAWLQLQMQYAQQQGDTALVHQVERRIATLQSP